VCGGAIAGHGSSPKLCLAWSMVAGLGRRELKTKGILTKGFTTKGHPRGELTTTVLPLHGSSQLGGFSSGRFTPGSAQVASRVDGA
jgi:hypothetical protein